MILINILIMIFIGHIIISFLVKPKIIEGLERLDREKALDKILIQMLEDYSQCSLKGRTNYVEFEKLCLTKNLTIVTVIRLIVLFYGYDKNEKGLIEDI